MFIKIQDLINKYNLTIRGIIHVGAHHGQEFDDYRAAGILPIVFVEPCRPAFEVLHHRFKDDYNVKLIYGSFGAEMKTVILHTETANTGQSNSILRPKKHLEQFPSIQFTGTEIACMYRMDNFGFLCNGRYNFLNIDTQGYELEVLKGGINTILHTIQFIYLEVNRAEVYEGCPHIDDIDKWLKPFGFDRMETFWCDGGTEGDWGDAFYIKVRKADIKIL